MAPAERRGVLGDSGLGTAVRVVLSIARFPVLALGFMAGLAVTYRYAPDRISPAGAGPAGAR